MNFGKVNSSPLAKAMPGLQHQVGEVKEKQLGRWVLQLLINWLLVCLGCLELAVIHTDANTWVFPGSAFCLFNPLNYWTFWSRDNPYSHFLQMQTVPQRKTQVFKMQNLSSWCCNRLEIKPDKALPSLHLWVQIQLSDSEHLQEQNLSSKTPGKFPHSRWLLKAKCDIQKMTQRSASSFQHTPAKQLDIHLSQCMLTHTNIWHTKNTGCFYRHRAKSRSVTYWN